MQKTAHALKLSAVHYAYLTALPATEKAALILSMSAAELTAYAAYLDATAYDYADDVPADYEPPTAASLFSEAGAVLLKADAEAYAAFSDAADASAPDPLPAAFGLTD